MTGEQRAELSADWLALLNGPIQPDVWTLGFDIVHRLTECVVGSCGFKGPADANGMVEIAYGILSEHENHGYATEAAEALVAFAFGSGHVRVVRAHTFAEENASARVLEKCGFQPLGQVFDPEDGFVWRWARATR